MVFSINSKDKLKLWVLNFMAILIKKRVVPVVHHKNFELLGIVHNELLETVWQVVTGLLV